MGAIEDILEWSTTKLTPWRRDALRLASSSTLVANDQTELLNLVKQKVGFMIAPAPPLPAPLNKTHLTAGASGAPLRLKAIRNVANVNRLVPSASLTFQPDGLTVIYGRNGSGKSGFVRIFRTACRTRTENAAKLKVLTDVYGTFEGPQTAEIVIDLGAGEVPVPWTAGTPASETLLQVAVFDTSAAQLYVDNGNHIQFLPFGLALPYKLNELCLVLKEKLEDERKLVTDQLDLVTVAFATPRTTKAQDFYKALNAKTTDTQIDGASKFSVDDETRIAELTGLLAASSVSSADVNALSAWVKTLAAECSSLSESFSDAKLGEFQALQEQAIEARTAAGLQATELFASEPLVGVGSETWRRLWLAARDYSIAEAYPERTYPVVSTADEIASCVLCHQPLQVGASERMSRFQAFVSGALAVAAGDAEAAGARAIADMKTFDSFTSKVWLTSIEQIRKRNTELADALMTFKKSMELRRTSAIAILQGATPPTDLFTIISPEAALNDLSSLLSMEAEALTKADEPAQRQILATELAELADRKILSAARDHLLKRRDLLKEDSLYAAALAETQTKGITQKANELVDEHLTKAVTDQFEVERKALDIMHLKIGLARKSGQTKAAFQTTPGTTLTKLSSEILSEGEQRALALAAFLTEIAVTAGSSPIVVDDPVSSLDRERGLKVAARIAEESKGRQVVVFTHDLIFFNDLCREADDRGVTAATIALFADGANAGKIDPAGVSWKGLPVAKRIGKIKNDFAAVKKLHGSSPTDYEFHTKNLYGRLRDAYERLVEEHIFCDVVRRGVDRIETQRLRMVHLSDALAIRFHEGMTKANTHSHDNPGSATVTVPEPAEFEKDLAFIEQLILDLKSESAVAESKRPSMKLKKD